MIRDTSTGLKFEEKVKIKQDGINIRKHELYSFLKKNNINWKDYISKQLLPDDGYYLENDNKVIIYEKKFQKTSGSADEKPQTCAFKLLEYKKLFAPLGITDVSYIYIFNDWFKKEQYKDMLEYIKSVDGCDYYFYEGE